MFDSLILQDFALRPRTRWAKQILGSALTLAPYCLNNHWVLVSLRHRPGTSSIISIQNSLGTFASKRKPLVGSAFFVAQFPGLRLAPLLGGRHSLQRTAASGIFGLRCVRAMEPGGGDPGRHPRLWSLGSNSSLVGEVSGGTLRRRASSGEALGPST